MIRIDIDVSRFRELFSELTPLRFSRAINAAAREMGEQALDEFIATTSSWDTDVEFNIEYDLRPSEGIASFQIGTPSDIYHWIDEGTPPHIIAAKRAKVLRYSDSFAPKTSPGALGSVGGLYSNEFIFADEVLNPGIRARGFSETISDMIMQESDDTILNQIQLAWIRQNG
jgi:hypothetical protein